MTSTNASRTRRRCAAGQLGLGLFAFFFTANLHIRDDGGGKIALVYPAASVTTFEIEKRRYDSETTRATSVRIDRGRVFVRVAFNDVNRLAEAPEFRNTTFRVEPSADGASRFRAEVRATLLGPVKSDGLARIRVTMPGEVLASNAQTSERDAANWSMPVTRYFSPEGIDLDATYRAKPPQIQARNTMEDVTP